MSIGNYTGGRFDYSIQDMEFAGSYESYKQYSVFIDLAEFPYTTLRCSVPGKDATPASSEPYSGIAGYWMRVTGYYWE